MISLGKQLFPTVSNLEISRKPQHTFPRKGGGLGWRNIKRSVFILMNTESGRYLLSFLNLRPTGDGPTCLFKNCSALPRHMSQGLNEAAEKQH